MTELIYLKNSYQKTLATKVVSVKHVGDQTKVILAATIFYPQGGGQPADFGVIIGKKGKLLVTHTRMQGKDVIHEGKLQGTLTKGNQVNAQIDWSRRFYNMRCHSAGHVLHEIIMQTVPGLFPIKADHGKTPYIQYQGMINPKLKETLEKQSNMLIAEGKEIISELVTLTELKKRVKWIDSNLPKNKPLRIIQIEGYPPITDGGTQVKNTSEIDMIKVTNIENLADTTQVYYAISKPKSLTPTVSDKISPATSSTSLMSLGAFRSLILELQNQILDRIKNTDTQDLEALKVSFFGSNGEATQLIKKLTDLPQKQRKDAGMLVNEFKASIKAAFADKQESTVKSSAWFDSSLPGIRPPQGHLHIVTQAIMEITRIFAKIGFTRVRHPEVDWDWYAFTSLNMPPNHPARDEWETFHIKYEISDIKYQKLNSKHPKFTSIVLTPHTSNGQVREMEKGRLPIRMINIAKNYRRQSDISHVPMLHQFEGLYIDRNVSITHLKGVCDYFFKQFYGPDRQSRLRPFHFQFTEPSFEIDVSCGICQGTGKLVNGQNCKLCKDGWLELGGAGMVHPAVLENGGIDPEKYNGFAFGWGVERTYMMKSGMQIDDIRLIYENDIKFLEQS